MKRHVELWAFNSKGQHVATGLVTPAGICGFTTSRLIRVDYNKRGFGFGFGVILRSERQFKERAKSWYRAVRFQRVLIGE